jgi:methyl-accepting chemotaxis protein
MSFTAKDKRALVEVINHIQHAYSSEQAFNESESTKITLPCRLVRLTAEVLSQTYEPVILSRLEGPELEVLLTSLLKSVDAMKGSLETVIGGLPEKLPPGMLNKLNEQVVGLEVMKGERKGLSAARTLIESGEEILAEKQELDDLRRRQEDLLSAQSALSEVDLDDLRGEVTRLETAIGPRRDEMELLQRSSSEKTAELESITVAISAVQEVLDAHDGKVKGQLDKVVDLSSNLIAALDPYLPGCERRIREAVETVAEKTAEGQRLKTELQTRITEVSEVFAETARIAGALSLYAQSNNRVAKSVPTVANITREKLSRIEEQLHEIDVELTRALERHQSAKHIAEVATF